MATIFQRGSILLVQAVNDPRGSNPKDRPCLVIDVVDAQFICVAITTSFQLDEPFRVELPWSRPRHPRTGLWEKSAVACDWFVQVSPEQVLERLGNCPGRQLLEVMHWIDQIP